MWHCIDTSLCSPLPSGGSRGRSFRSPAVPHLPRCRVGGGAFDCSHAGLRPPLKLGVQFSRTQLSQRRSFLSSDGRNHRNQVDKPILSIELAAWKCFPSAAAPLAVSMRPNPSHYPTVELVEEQSDASPLVVVAPPSQDRVNPRYQLLGTH